MLNRFHKDETVLIDYNYSLINTNNENNISVATQLRHRQRLFCAHLNILLFDEFVGFGEKCVCILSILGHRGAVLTPIL